MVCQRSEDPSREADSQSESLAASPGNVCLYMIRCEIHVVIIIGYDDGVAYKRLSDGDQRVVRT